MIGVFWIIDGKRSCADDKIGMAEKNKLQKERIEGNQESAEGTNYLGFNRTWEKYDSKNRPDPFLPLIRKKEENTAQKDMINDQRNEKKLSPLETMDFSQLRLVAIVQMKPSKLAMVEDPSGKGYLLQIGTYIGKNSGKITQINSDSILIKEKIKTNNGKVMYHFRDIKLHQVDNCY